MGRKAAAPRTQPDGRMRILVGADDSLVRQGLRCLIARRWADAVVYEAAKPRELEAVLREGPFDAVVVDTRLAPAAGSGTTPRRPGSPPATVVLGPLDGLADVQRAFAAGADGYVAREDGAEHIVEAIASVAEGRRYLDPRVGAELVLGESPGASNGRLTQVEREVLALVVQGFTSRQIAAALGRPVRTVEGLRARGQRKLGVSGRAALVAHAAEHGLEPPRLNGAAQESNLPSDGLRRLTGFEERIGVGRESA